MSPSSGQALRVLLHEGMHLKLVRPAHEHPRAALCWAWGCSILLKGRPVLLTGWPDGACLHVATRLEMHAALPGFLRAAAPRALELVAAWRELGAPSPATLPLPYSTARLARHDWMLPAAAARIDWIVSRP